MTLTPVSPLFDTIAKRISRMFTSARLSQYPSKEQKSNCEIFLVIFFLVIFLVVCDFDIFFHLPLIHAILYFWSASFPVQYGDHFRPGIICGSIWVLFPVPDHLRSRDHLRTRRISQFIALQSLRWVKSLTFDSIIRETFTKFSYQNRPSCLGEFSEPALRRNKKKT